MFLSRLRPHPRDLLVLRDLGDPGQLHRTLMRAFPQADGPRPRSQFGVLFRVETDGGQPSVLVQSQVLPDWDMLPEGYVMSHETREISAVLDAIQAGRGLRFRLTANPSRKSAAHRPNEAPPRNSRRVALVTDEERHAWLVARGARDGFVLVGGGAFDGVRIDPQPSHSGAGHTGRSGIVVRAVQFEGRLQVVDAELMRRAVREGVGPAKAYGCGLLSLAAG